MRQDAEAKRYNEVDLFSGTVIKLGEQFGVKTLVNRYFLDRIQDMEASYG